MPCDNKGKERSNAFTSQGKCEATKRGQAQNGPPQVPAQGAWPCWHYGLGLLTSGRNSEGIYLVVLSHPICGTWLQKP